MYSHPGEIELTRISPARLTASAWVRAAMPSFAVVQLSVCWLVRARDEEILMIEPPLLKYGMNLPIRLSAVNCTTVYKEKPSA